MSKLTLSLSSLVLVALLGACSKTGGPAPETTPAPAPATVAETAPAASAAPTPAANENGLGKSVFGKVCSMCHAAGVAGAPKPGDHDDWGPRIAQGNDVLYKHALGGFNGSKGSMPARGGNPGLKDEEVRAAVDYMVSLSR
ncbi:c-type cytochrome [Roseateles saccharophilus]|nr:c-type cytochrome [Roseateles saccharophilus]MDG0831745.1 cytochrome c5 family protein [Roseateles saccharophilus]